MNLTEKVIFDQEKPNVVSIKKSEKIQYFAVALGKNVTLKKHITAVPATLCVLKGELEFLMENNVYFFKELDTFEIPVHVEHEVVGRTDENLFTIIKEL